MKQCFIFGFFHTILKKAWLIVGKQDELGKYSDISVAKNMDLALCIIFDVKNYEIIPIENMKQCGTIWNRYETNVKNI